MQQEINQFTNEVSAIISQITTAGDNKKVKIKAGSKVEQAEELSKIIYYIASFIPYHLYLKENKNACYAFQALLAKDLIFFLAQEDPQSPNFKLYLTNFKDEMLSQLINNVYVRKNAQ